VPINIEDIALITKLGQIYLKANFNRTGENKAYFSQGWQQKYKPPIQEEINDATITS
jgi:hypothetical protein